MSLSPRARFLAAAILGIALVIRLVAACWWQSRLGEQPFAFPDSHSYWDLGQTIADGTTYQYQDEDQRVFRMPGYPLLLGGLFGVLGPDVPVLWARAVGAVLGTITVGSVGWLAGRLFDEKTAIVAAGIVALYPGAIGTSVFVLSEALFCPLMMIQLVLWHGTTQASAGKQWWLAAGVGAVAGVATLVRPSWLLFTPLLLGVALIASCQRRRVAQLAPAVLAGLIAVMAPWWMRNYAVTGKFIPTTLQAGASLYDGLHPQATGASDMSFVDDFRRQQVAQDAQQTTALVSTFEYRLNQRLWRSATAWATQNPACAVQLAGIKLLRMWNVWSNATEFQSPRMRAIVMLTYTPLLLVGLVGACRLGWRQRATLICLAPACYLTLLHLIFVGSLRYRQPALLPMMILAAALVARWEWPHKVGEQRS